MFATSSRSEAATAPGYRGHGPFHTTRPYITTVTRSSSVMSASGSRATATRSAYLPAATTPTSECVHVLASGRHIGSSSAAATDVIDRITAAGGIPAVTINLASAAGSMLHGNAPASVPNTILTPRLYAFVNATACNGFMNARSFCAPSFFWTYVYASIVGHHAT